MSEHSNFEANDAIKGLEEMLKGTPPKSTPKSTSIEVTDPEQFLPHERLIAKDLHAISHLLSLDTAEMTLALKRIVYFVEHYKAKDESK